MTTVRRLIELAVYPVAMGAGAGLCLWVLLGPLRIDRLASKWGAPAMPEPPLAPGGRPTGVANPGAPATAELPLVPDEKPSGLSERVVTAMADLPLVRGDRGPLVAQLQGALIKNGYWVGPAGTDGTLNGDTLAALATFQDNNALPMQPACNRQCWAALGLPE